MSTGAVRVRTSTGWRDLALVGGAKVELTTWHFAEAGPGGVLAQETFGSAGGSWLYEMDEYFDFPEEAGTALLMDGFCTVLIEQNWHGMGVFIDPGFTTDSYSPGYWPSAAGSGPGGGWRFSGTGVGNWFGNGNEAATIPLNVAMGPRVSMGPHGGNQKIPCIYFEHSYSTVSLLSVNYSIRKLENLEEA